MLRLQLNIQEDNDVPVSFNPHTHKSLQDEAEAEGQKG